MPQLQNLVLTDRAATPVAHTLVPREIVNGAAHVVETSGVPVGELDYSISNRRANGKFKIRCLFVVPVVQTETINGISSPKVVRDAKVDCTFTFAATSTEAERNNVVGMFQDSLATGKTLVHNTVVKLEGLYGA